MASKTTLQVVDDDPFVANGNTELKTMAEEEAVSGRSAWELELRQKNTPL